MRRTKLVLLSACTLALSTVAACKHNDESVRESRTAGTIRNDHDADAIATLTAVGPASPVKGTISLDDNTHGADLLVDIRDAAPGRYTVQILDVGTCAELDDTKPRGSEETTGGGISTGASPAMSSAAILARVDVGNDRTGRTQVALTRAQLGANDPDDLEQHLVILREDRTEQSIQDTTQTIAADTGIMACGTLEDDDDDDHDGEG